MIRKLLVLSLALFAGNSLAAESLPKPGLPLVPVSRIVGLWQVSVTLAPCAGGPSRSFIAYSTYHAGGTMSDTNAAPPTTRGPGQGVWQYQGQGQYRSRFQFFRYQPDGTFSGVTDVQTEITLSADGLESSSDVHARNLDPDGSVQAELCGIGVAQRVSIE